MRLQGVSAIKYAYRQIIRTSVFNGPPSMVRKRHGTAATDWSYDFTANHSWQSYPNIPLKSSCSCTRRSLQVTLVCIHLRHFPDQCLLFVFHRWGWCTEQSEFCSCSATGVMVDPITTKMLPTRDTRAPCCGQSTPYCLASRSVACY